MTLAEAAGHVGEKVLYQAAASPPEEGVITSVNERYVFVRYGTDGCSLATPAEYLTLAGDGS